MPETRAEPPAPPQVSAAAVELLGAVSDPADRDTLTALFRRAPDLCVEDDGETLTLLRLPAVVLAELQAHYEGKLQQIANTYRLKETLLRSEVEQDPWVIRPNDKKEQGLRTSDLLTVLARTARPGQLAAWVREVRFIANEDELEVIVEDDRTATAIHTHFWSALHAAALLAGCTSVGLKNLAREGKD
jgi:hypothetical protein